MCIPGSILDFLLDGDIWSTLVHIVALVFFWLSGPRVEMLTSNHIYLRV